MNQLLIGPPGATEIAVLTGAVRAQLDQLAAAVRQSDRSAEPRRMGDPGE